MPYGQYTIILGLGRDKIKFRATGWSPCSKWIAFNPNFNLDYSHIWHAIACLHILLGEANHSFQKADDDPHLFEVNPAWADCLVLLCNFKRALMRKTWGIGRFDTLPEYSRWCKKGIVTAAHRIMICVFGPDSCFFFSQKSWVAGFWLSIPVEH